MNPYRLMCAAIAGAFFALSIAIVLHDDPKPRTVLVQHRQQEVEGIKPDPCKRVIVIDKIDVANPGKSDRHTWLLTHEPGSNVTFICNRNGDYGNGFLKEGMTVQLEGWSGS